MDAEIHFEITDDLLRRAVWRYFRCDRRGMLLGAVAIPALALANWLLKGTESVELTWMLLALGIIFPMVTAGVYHTAVRGALANFGKLSDHGVTWRVTDDSLEVRTPLGHAQLPWQMADRLLRFPDVWLLFFFRHEYLIVPTSALAPDVADFISMNIQGHGGKLEGRPLPSSKGA